MVVDGQWNFSTHHNDQTQLIRRLQIGQVPKTVENFQCLLTGEKGKGKSSGKSLHYNVRCGIHGWKECSQLQCLVLISSDFRAKHHVGMCHPSCGLRIHDARRRHCQRYSYLP